VSAVARTCILKALANGRPATSASVAQRLRVSIPKVELWLGVAVYDGEVTQTPRRVGTINYSMYQLSATGREKAKALPK
jgi:Mn-dependent DtxR family transcriptional regulator